MLSAVSMAVLSIAAVKSFHTLMNPWGILPQDEAEKYLNLLKKTLSGKLGKNLIDIIFSTEQVADSDEHRLLMALRDSQLKDGDIREEFYQQNHQLS